MAKNCRGSSPLAVKQAAVEADEWKLVGSKMANVKKVQMPAKAAIKISQKVQVLATNSFYLPAPLEKKLHLQDSGFSPPDASTSLRCFKRNQRRNRRRAEQSTASRKIQEQPKDAGLKPSPDAVNEAEMLVENILKLPEAMLNGILSYLSPQEIVKFGASSQASKVASEKNHLWKALFERSFAKTPLSLISSLQEWKLAYQLTDTKMVEHLRCSHTKKTFFEDVIGVGVDFSANPKTCRVDYISMSQDLLSQTAFAQHKIRTDSFGNSF